MIRPLTAPMRAYLRALLLGADLREWTSPRWSGMRASLVARGLITRPAKGERTELTDYGREVAGKLGPCGACGGKGWVAAAPTGGAWSVTCRACEGRGTEVAS